MIIGISGRKQSGKSTIGNIINDLTNNKFKIIQFANPIKQFITEILGCTREQLENDKFKNTELDEEWTNSYDAVYYTNLKYETLTPRKLMQLIGTDMGRVIHPNIWINATMREYKCTRLDTHSIPGSCIFPNWIITDVRFENEIKAIENRGGFIIRVNRRLGLPDEEMARRIQDSLHPSETSLDNHTFKYTITNNGTIEELINNVKEILIKEDIL